MNKQIYRGVAFDPTAAKVEDRIISRPHLYYRGIEHNGVKAIEQRHTVSGMFYRGLRVA